MRELVRASDPVLVTFIEALLKSEGIAIVVADVNMSVLEGSLSILPRRLLVAEEDAERAARILADCGLAHWLVRHDG
jgi:hypothetical protein